MQSEDDPDVMSVLIHDQVTLVTSNKSFILCDDAATIPTSNKSGSRGRSASAATVTTKPTFAQKTSRKKVRPSLHWEGDMVASPLRRAKKASSRSRASAASATATGTAAAATAGSSPRSSLASMSPTPTTPTLTARATIPTNHRLIRTPSPDRSSQMKVAQEASRAGTVSPERGRSRVRAVFSALNVSPLRSRATGASPPRWRRLVSPSRRRATTSTSENGQRARAISPEQKRPNRVFKPSPKTSSHQYQPSSTVFRPERNLLI